jgi:hypothetical protein
MSQLVPCPSCGRHVRLPSASCPFCDSVLDASSLDERYAPRRGAVSAGIKRAAIFAVGAGMAAACGGETDNVQPVYGAPITSDGDPTSGGDQDTSEPSAQPLYGAPVNTTEPSAQPVYGAPVDTTDVDTEPMGQPEYGAPVPIDEDASVVAIYGAPVPPTDAGTSMGDAGAGDAGPDAAIPDEPTLNPDPGPTVVPLYGAPPN